MIVDEIEVGHVHVKERDGSFDRPARSRSSSSQAMLTEDWCFEHEGTGPPSQLLPYRPWQASEERHHIWKIANKAVTEGSGVQWHREEIDGSNSKNSCCKRCRRPHTMEHNIRLELFEGGELAINESLRDLFRAEELWKVP